MKAYVDTGVMVKGYVFEPGSPEAIAKLEAAGVPLVFSHLHAVEIPNAIRLKRFRQEITPRQEEAAIRAFQSDIDTGRLSRPGYDLSAVFIRAASLSTKYSAALGTRSLDILHVAAALEAGCTEFVSFDGRQRQLAALAGLKVKLG